MRDGQLSVSSNITDDTASTNTSALTSHTKGSPQLSPHHHLIPWSKLIVTELKPPFKIWVLALSGHTSKFLDKNIQRLQQLSLT